jgi:hypothetical protein
MCPGEKWMAYQPWVKPKNWREMRDFLYSHILGIITPTDYIIIYNIFQRG